MPHTGGLAIILDIAVVTASVIIIVIISGRSYWYSAHGFVMLNWCTISQLYTRFYENKVRIRRDIL